MTEGENGQPAYQPFVTGWLKGEDAWGRPNDVMVAPDGSLLISDDRTGQIFQVRFEGSGSTVAAVRP